MKTYAFNVQKTDHSQYRTIINKKDHGAMPGEILLEIEKYAFTANNITYAILGDDLRYWNFFPTENQDNGIIPVWGIARAVKSENPDLEVGSRFYGYFPMASELKVLPSKIRETGFTDQTPHRTTLPAIYNFYSNLASDEMHITNYENLELVFRPLFSTSFLLDDFLFSNDFYDSSEVIITSASSKTAIALAYLLSLRKKARPELRITGFTSKSNLEFVRSLGCYDELFLYDSFDKLPLKNSVIIDFSGNQKSLNDMKNHLTDFLKYTSLVGLVQWDKRETKSDSTIGTVFFAPQQVKKRSKEWGISGFQKMVSASWNKFIDFAKDHFKVIEVSPEDLGKVYSENLQGKVPPNSAYVIVHS
jgi:hypothetical protein